MKISHMNLTQVAAVVEKVPPALKRIMEDEELRQGVAKWAQRKGEAPAVGIMTLVSEAAPVLLNRHMDDTVLILSALTGKSEKRVRRQRLSTTIRDMRKCMDKDVLDFFRHAAGMKSARFTRRHGEKEPRRPSQQ